MSHLNYSGQPLFSDEELAEFDRSTARLTKLCQNQNIQSSNIRDLMSLLGFSRQKSWIDTDAPIDREFYVNLKVTGDCLFSVPINSNGEIDAAIVQDIVAQLQAYGLI